MLSPADARQWLTAALAELDLDDQGPSATTLCARIRAERPAFQVALLKVCVERLPLLRAEGNGDGDRSNYRLGSILYEAVCELYGDRLPYDESDICVLLRTSKHGCGHGQDVVAPFDLAIDHARRFGLTRELLEALGVFIGGLTGIQSSKAQHLKRRAALVFVLDTDGWAVARPCWSDRFRLGLAALPAAERVQWHQLVLQMSVSEQPRQPTTWRKTTGKFVGELGVAHVTQRLAQWWPAPRPDAWTLESGGSQLLRHFVWMLHVMRESATPDEKASCDDLVRQLAFLDWKPRERAKKVAVAVASYLVECPAETAADGLRHLSHWSLSLKYSDWEPNRVAVLAREFATRHGLDRTAFASPHAVKKGAVAPPALELAASALSPTRSPDTVVRAVSTSKGWLGGMLAALRRGFSG